MWVVLTTLFMQPLPCLCFGGGGVGHLVRDCPKQQRDGANQAGPGATHGEAAVAGLARRADETPTPTCPPHECN